MKPAQKPIFPDSARASEIQSINTSRYSRSIPASAMPPQTSSNGTSRSFRQIHIDEIGVSRDVAYIDGHDFDFLASTQNESRILASYWRSFTE
jgi:hypothetical protein